MSIEAGSDEEAVEICLIFEGVSHSLSKAAGHTIAFSLVVSLWRFDRGPFFARWQTEGDGKTRRNVPQESLNQFHDGGSHHRVFTSSVVVAV
jgi:hypothetical protein